MEVRTTVTNKAMLFRLFNKAWYVVHCMRMWKHKADTTLYYQTNSYRTSMLLNLPNLKDSLARNFSTSQSLINCVQGSFGGI